MDTAALVFKVLAQKATQAECESLEQWVNASIANRVEYEDLRMLWNSRDLAASGSVGHFYDGLAKIKAQIRQKIDDRRKKTTWAWSGVLAVALLTNIFVFYAASEQGQKNEFLEFNNIPVSEVLATLKSEYGIHIETEQITLASCRFTGAFYNVEGEEVVRILTRALNANYKKKTNGSFSLAGKGC